MRNGKRMIFLVVLGVLLLGSVSQLAADFKVDIGVNIPYYVGVTTDDGDAGDALDWVFLVPDVKFNWLHNLGPVRLGGGLRLWTFIIQSMAYPILTAEVDVGPVTFNANAGGGLFLFFGLYNSIDTAGVFVPELSAAYRFTDSFSVGTGGLFVFAPEVQDLSSFAYVGTVFARFTIRPD